MGGKTATPLRHSPSGITALEKVYPERTWWRPRLGRKIVIAFGEPVEMGDLVQRWKEGELGEVEARVLITPEAVCEAVEEVRRQVEEMERY